MYMFGGVPLILLLTAQTFTAMPHGMMSSTMPYRNDSMPYRSNSVSGFPPLPAGFSSMALRLMMQCFKMGCPLPKKMEVNQTSFAEETGYDMAPNPYFLIPSLLSSLPSVPGSTALPGQPNDSTTEKDLNVTLADRLMNCSDLLGMIDIIRNSTDESECLLRASVAPLSWEVLVTNGMTLAQSDFTRLLWGAEPLLRHAPPPILTLPLGLEPWQLNEMMELLSEVFDSLSRDHRQQVLRWITLQLSKMKIDSIQITEEWLTAGAMETMGRYLFLLPSVEFEALPNEELCTFFWSSRLGSLACFYDDTSSLNASLSKTLLPQLGECRNSDGIKLRKQLVRRVISDDSGSVPSLSWFLDLGAPVISALPLSQLARLSAPALWDALPSLSKSQWQPAQARTLARTLLQGKESVSLVELVRLGSIARGVRSTLLRKVRLQGMMGMCGLAALSQELSPLQRLALLEGLLGNVSFSELAYSITGNLLSDVSLSTLKRAGLRSLEQLEGQEWTRAQSVFLVKEILGQTLQSRDIGKLGSAVRGVTCEMIDKTNQSDVFPLVRALLQSKHWLSRTQISCAAEKLFESLERERSGYFSNITEQELKAIPTVMLIYLRTELISELPDSVCSCLLDKVSQADLSLQPLSSGPRVVLLSRTLDCLRKNLSSLTPDDITSLGALVTELDPYQLLEFSPAALNTTLLALAKSPQIRPYHRGPLFELLTKVHGEPSHWSLDTMMSLGPLLLWVNDSAIRTLQYKPWLKVALTDLLDSLPPSPSHPQPAEFRTHPELSALHWKLFSLATTSACRNNADHNRMDCPPAGPTLMQVLEVGQGNVYWTPAQLGRLPDEAFREGVSTLGTVQGYTPKQLQALRNKAVQVWGPVGSLSEDQLLQLGCLTQSFSPAELQEIGDSSLDTLELLSACGWSQSQSEALLQGFMRSANLSIGELGVAEVVGLGQFICGMSPVDVDKLNTDTFRDAMRTLGAVHCEQEVTERLKDRALVIFGRPANWTEAQVNILGNIIGVLNSSELPDLNPAVFPFIHQSAIPLILPHRLAALSVTQLRAMGPDNAAMVTDTQYNALSWLQQDAVHQALGLQIFRSPASAGIPSLFTTHKPGTSRHRMMGSVVFWQSLLLLLIFSQ
ncbi:hypothetical protein GJAV_G00102810 [Gymnothorax javanicus]|nr:hypothetical protein GJAV_G00102810 [Gymnothorax javanicus]